MNLAQFPALGQVNGRLKVGPVPPLGACLKDPLVLADGLVKFLAKPDGQTAGLFTVDVFTGLGGKHRRVRMPVVSGANHDGLDIGPGEQLAKIAVGGAVLVAVMPVHECLGDLATAGLHVADGHTVNVALGEHLA